MPGQDVSGQYFAAKFHKYGQIVQLTQFDPPLPVLRLRATSGEMVLELGPRHFTVDGEFKLTKRQAAALAEILGDWSAGGMDVAPADSPPRTRPSLDTDGVDPQANVEPAGVPGGRVVASRGAVSGKGKGGRPGRPRGKGR